MVLADIGIRISNALKKMTNSTVINNEVIDEMLKEISNALVTADVSLKMVIELTNNLRKALDLDSMASGHNKRMIIRKAVFEELCKLLDPKIQPYKPVRGKVNIVVFVGLQGNGKTTTVSKYAYYYKRKGWRPVLLCVDTFRAGAFDQLMQNAAAAKVHFYGNRTERDPVRLAKEGIERLKADPEMFDLIIVDTSGRHKQEGDLFEEMKQIVKAINPNQIVLVMDGSMGQMAYDQAKAFKEAVKVGAVIVTKMDGHAKGGGALSAVAATQSPIIFLGTGERLENLEEFEAAPFVSKLLGLGDWKGLIDILKTSTANDERSKNLNKRIQAGKYSLRDLYDQFETILNMGPISQLMDKLPGIGQISQAKGEESNKKFKNYIVIMDSMTDEELDVPKIINQSRIARIARGSGRSIKEVNEVLMQHKTFEKIVCSGITNKFKSGYGNIGASQRMAKLIPQNVLQQVGGLSGINNIMKQMGGNLKDMF